jgi:2-oxoglutarate ferredoxin oxidoreductase subunit alpha
LAGECGFGAIYPMTPVNSILTLLAKEKIALFRPEDEIAGVTAAIGAAYAGERAMVATSGGGFSLMVEGLGMAGMTETPVVIVLGQRTGPSTGIATYSSQADLKFVINAGQGEFPRIVLTPGDLPELYRLGAEALNLAEMYQVPVILMTDKYLAESRFSEEENEIAKIKIKINRGKLAKIRDLRGYRRFKLTKDGISPRAFPGQTTFLTNSYEHDESGFSTDEAKTRTSMVEKRGKKLVDLESGLEFFGPKKAEVTLVGWGSTKGVLWEIANKNTGLNFLHLWRPWPFSREAGKILEKSKKVVVVESNYSGQMADIIEMKAGIKTERILKDDGRPFFKEELERKLRII